jgi:hypothetical protein
MSDYSETFSVCLYYVHRTYKFSEKDVTLRQASRSIVENVNSIDAKSGVLNRVTIIDGGDRIVFEWRYVLGVVFPPNLKGMRLNVTPPKPGPDQALENFAPGNPSGHRGALLVRPTPR